MRLQNAHACTKVHAERVSHESFGQKDQRSRGGRESARAGESRRMRARMRAKMRARMRANTAASMQTRRTYLFEIIQPAQDHTRIDFDSPACPHWAFLRPPSPPRVRRISPSACVPATRRAACLCRLRGSCMSLKLLVLFMFIAAGVHAHAPPSLGSFSLPHVLWHHRRCASGGEARGPSWRESALASSPSLAQSVHPAFRKQRAASSGGQLCRLGQR